MKTIVKFFLGLLCAGWGATLIAQCPFNPTITPSQLQLCPNGIDTLWTQPATSYQWYRSGTPITNSNQQFLIVSHTQDAGNNFVVASTINSCTEASPAVAVSAYTLPALSISLADNAPVSGCEGDVRQLILNDPYNVTIRWFRNGVQLTGQTDDTLLVIQSGMYSAIAYTDQCPNTSQTSPLTNITLAPWQQPVIQFNSSSLALSVTTTATSYQWSINGTPVEGANASSFLPQANGDVTLEAIFSAACARFSLPYAYSSYVQDCPQNPLVTPGDLILCPGTSDTLFTQLADSYQWFKEGAAIIGATQPFLEVTAFQDAGASFSVESVVSGCAEMSPAVLVDGWLFLPMTVTTYGLENPTLCEGDTLILQVNQPYTENISWFLNGSLIEGQTDDSLLVLQSGTYTVTGFTSLCPDYSDTSIPLEYTFGAAPQPLLTFYPVSNSLGTTETAVSYSWSLNGGILPGANAPVLNVSDAGSYELTCTYSNGCSNTSLPYVYDPTGISETATLTLRVQPNPAQEIVSLKLPENGMLEVYDLAGKLHMHQFLNAGLHSLHMAQLPTGMYLMKFRTAHGLHVAKVLLTD